MSTDNMPDEELDKLFRQSADSFDPPFDPEAWKAMEAKLDQAPGELPWWHRLLYPAVLVLLIGTGLTVHRLQREPAALPVAAEQVASGQVAAPAQQVPTTTHPEQLAQQRSEESATAGAPARSVTATVPPQPPARTRGRQQPAKTMAPAAAEASWTFHLDSTLKTHDTQPATAGIAGSPVPPVAAFKMKTHTTDSAGLLQETRYSRPFLRSLQVMLVAAPDVTSVKFKGADALSMNAGVLVGVPLTRRFSIVTGALWADKVYRASPENYAPSPDYWTGRKPPSSIDAACRVLDVPLNIRYSLHEGEKASISVQAGLSSYFMLNEKYTYHYSYGSQPYSKTREIENRNEHWFGVQNLSAGYSRKLSPQLSVGVEPFVKIPLSGIGDGKVRLTSTGVFFTAGYTLPLKP